MIQVYKTQTKQNSVRQPHHVSGRGVSSGPQQIEYKTSSGSGLWLKTQSYSRPLYTTRILILDKSFSWQKNLRCIVLVAPKTFEALFYCAHSSSISWKPPNGSIFKAATIVYKVQLGWVLSGVAQMNCFCWRGWNKVCVSYVRSSSNWSWLSSLNTTALEINTNYSLKRLDMLNVLLDVLTAWKGKRKVGHLVDAESILHHWLTP